MILFCPEVVNERWMMDYYSTRRPTTPRRPSCVSQATPRRAPLTERHKYNDIILLTQQINLLLSRSGTQKYIARKQQLQEIVTLWKEDRDFMLTELLPEEPDEEPQELPQIDEESQELPQTDEEPDEEPLEIPQTDEEPQELPQTDEEPDEEPQELPHVSFRTNLPNVNNTTDENTLSVDLEGVSLPTVSKKRGRPKGSCTTAIGLPKGKSRTR